MGALQVAEFASPLDSVLKEHERLERLLLTKQDDVGCVCTNDASDVPQCEARAVSEHDGEIVKPAMEFARSSGHATQIDGLSGTDLLVGVTEREKEGAVDYRDCGSSVDEG